MNRKITTNHFLGKTVLCFAFFFIVSFSVNAQNKAEEKEWAKKMKQMKPMDFKKLVEDNKALRTSAEAAESSKASLQAELDSKNAEIEKLKAEMESSNTAAAPVAEVAESNGQTASSAASTGATKGVQYKVQIGTFKNKNLTSYFNNNPNFSGETDPDGSKRYTLGLFKDYWEADKFKHYLREMGVRDAWVVAYKNGKRVDIKEVLEGSL